MGKIVNFKDYIGVTDTDQYIYFSGPILESDSYLQMYIIKLLDSFGYDNTSNGVKELQKAMGKKTINGVVGIEECNALAEMLAKTDPEEALAFTNYLKDALKEEEKEQKEKSKYGILIMIWSVLFVVFFTWGFVDFMVLLFKFLFRR